MGYIFELEEELLMLLPGLLSGIPTGLLGIATYVLSALAIYNISRRRGLKKPWLAWIPVVNCWLLGSLSDQYQYVVKGEIKSKRKWLLGLSIVMHLLSTVMAVMGLTIVGKVVFGGYHPNHGMLSRMMGPIMTLLGSALPLAAAAIAYAVIRYMALYDVYRSLDPGNAVLYLVLSILCKPTEPFFLFFNREKDLGMPPRKQPVYDQPVYEQPVPEQDYTYETPDSTEYL